MSRPNQAFTQERPVVNGPVMTGARRSHNVNAVRGHEPRAVPVYERGHLTAAEVTR
jgi:hypothetical protein